MNDRANFFRAHAIGHRPTTMYLPFVHLTQRPQHRQVHHRTGLGVDHLVTPAKAPAPCGHRLLKWAREVICRRKVFFHILRAKCRFAPFKTFQEKVLIE